jgi:hypothetical protein
MTHDALVGTRPPHRALAVPGRALAQVVVGPRSLERACNGFGVGVHEGEGFTREPTLRASEGGRVLRPARGETDHRNPEPGRLLGGGPAGRKRNARATQERCERVTRELHHGAILMPETKHDTAVSTGDFGLPTCWCRRVFGAAHATSSSVLRMAGRRIASSMTGKLTWASARVPGRPITHGGTTSTPASQSRASSMGFPKSNTLRSPRA